MCAMFLHFKIPWLEWLRQLLRWLHACAFGYLLHLWKSITIVKPKLLLQLHVHSISCISVVILTSSTIRRTKVIKTSHEKELWQPAKCCVPRSIFRNTNWHFTLNSLIQGRAASSSNVSHSYHFNLLKAFKNSKAQQ